MVDYMIKQQEDFEPFVEDDVLFEKHGMVSIGHQWKGLLCNVITSHLSTFLLNIASSQSYGRAPLWFLETEFTFLSVTFLCKDELLNLH